MNRTFATRFRRPSASSTGKSFKVVGVEGFEPATSSSQTMRTTKLCYTPKMVSSEGIEPPMHNATDLQSAVPPWNLLDFYQKAPIKGNVKGL